MTKGKINTHHGSPGSPRDFFHLKLVMPDYEFYSRDRVYDKLNKLEDDGIVELGYSFGSYYALLSAAENLNKTKHIFLISPYLIPEKATSFAVKAILNIGPLRNLILNKKAPSAIEELLEKSSYPSAIPEIYKKDAVEYLDPKRLGHAICEKNIDSHTIHQLFRELEKRKIPITIIYGKKDKTSREETQVDVFLKYKNINIEFIETGGHALLWTHTNEIKKIIEDKLEKKHKFGYYKGSNKNNNVASFLKDHNSKNPNKNILTWVDREELEKWINQNPPTETIKQINSPLPHRSIKVKELDYLVGILTKEFQNIGIKFNDRVILFLPMSLPMYASMFALQKMGAIPTFLDSWARRDQMGVSAKVATPNAMISAHRAFDYLKDVEGIKDIPIKIVAGDAPVDLKYTAKLEELMKASTYGEEVEVESEHTALITFTTGSSGTPKGADRSHRFLAAQHYALNRHIPYSDNDKDLPVFPIFSLNNLAAGVETIIPAIDVGAPKESDALILYQQIISQSVTCTTVSPSLFNGLSKFCLEHKITLNLKRIVTGGAPISRDDVEKMKKVAPEAEILILYGSTEVEPMAHIEAKEMLNAKAPIDPEIVDPGVNVGHLDDGLRYKFVKITKDPLFVKSTDDWQKIEVKKDSVGELIVSGEHVCEKYYNNQEAFIHSKIEDCDRKIWHRTGDLGFVDEFNNLWIVGRVHNAIKRKEDYFFPVRAEIILKRFTEIEKAAFLGFPDSELGQKTIAVYSLRANINDNQKSNIKNEIKRILEKNNFIVDCIVEVEDIPMDPRHHSKVEYAVLRQYLTSRGLV